MKKIILLLFIIILALAAVLFLGKTEIKDVTITVPEGSSISTVAQILKENDLIFSRFQFVRKAESTEGYIKPGEYTITTGTDVDEIIRILKNGAQDYVTLTIPEGFSVEMIAKRAEESGLCTEKEFLEAADSLDYDYAFVKYIKPSENAKYKLQGFLYPNTYFIAKNATARDIVKTLLGEFEKQIKTIGVPYESINRAVTIASLLQREALVESEKPIIAGVIENRLNQNMVLQIDAAVVYAVTDGRYDVNAVYNTDLKSNSPYNLYKYSGLPPGPICNPDIGSIAAALNPQTHDFLYYRTDEKKNDGSHIFTKTYNEHLNANN